MAARNASSEPLLAATCLLADGRRRACNEAPARTTELSAARAVATAMDSANAPLLRATLANPHRSGAGGRGISKPTMISPGASEGIGPAHELCHRLGTRALGSTHAHARTECDEAGRPIRRRIGECNAAADGPVI